MKPPFHVCPGSICSTKIQPKWSNHESFNLTSNWTQERGIVHELLLETPNTNTHTEESSNADFMKSLNDHLLQAYINMAIKERVTIEEILIKSTGFFPQESKRSEQALPDIRVIYRTIMDASGTAASLSHVHNLVKQEVTQAFSKSAILQINSQLLVY